MESIKETNEDIQQHDGNETVDEPDDVQQQRIRRIQIQIPIHSNIALTANGRPDSNPKISALRDSREHTPVHFEQRRNEKRIET